MNRDPGVKRAQGGPGGAETLTALKNAAEGGDVGAQVRLGRALLQGAGVVRDVRQARGWLLRAAESGNGDAQAEMGFLYEKGLGVEADLRQALAWYERAAAQENPLGQVRMGDLFLSGLGIDQSYRQACARYLQAAGQGRDRESAALALMRLGDLHSQGRGVEKNLRQGFAFYLQAARRGNAEAQRRVAALYRDGVGVVRDAKKAQFWLQKSTGRSGVPADSALGDLYRDGLVVARDPDEAAKFYERAAARGDAYARGELLKLRQERERAASRPVPPTPPPGAAPAGAGPRADAVPAANLPTVASEKRPAQKAGKPARSRPAQVREHPPVRKPAGRRRFPLWPAAAFLVLAAAAAAWLQRGPAGAPAAVPAVVLPPARNYAPPRPALPCAPAAALLPPAVDRSARPAAKKAPPAEAPPAAPAAAPAPPAPGLRRVAATLGETELVAALAARDLFDAVRNPAGRRRQPFAAQSVSGLAVVVDRAAGLVWTQRPHPVKMSRLRSLQWIDSLNRARYGGIDTWRLPTVEEAATLLRPAAGETSRFLADPFAAGATAVWTADRVSESESWAVDFQTGALRPVRSKSKLATLMVSSAPASAP